MVPAAVTRWENLAAEDDLVAAHLDLKPYFPPAPGSTVTPHMPMVARGQPVAPAPGDIGPQGVPHVGRNFINGLGGLPGRPRRRAVASRPMPSVYSLDRAR